MLMKFFGQSGFKVFRGAIMFCLSRSRELGVDSDSPVILFNCRREFPSLRRPVALLFSTLGLPLFIGGGAGFWLRLCFQVYRRNRKDSEQYRMRTSYLHRRNYTTAICGA
jgi:hypothetical protein